MAYADISSNTCAWRAISAHLPHNGYSDVEFEAALEVLRNAFPRNRTSRSTVIGVDANAEVGKQYEGDDSRSIGKHGLGTRSCRGVVFAAWVEQQRLCIANTFFQKRAEDLWTHRMWSTGTKRQIDYVMFDRFMGGELRNARVVCDMMQSSDHRGVWARIGTQRKRTKKWTPPKTGKGWQRTATLAEYHAAQCEVLTDCKQTLEGVTEAIIKVASSCGKVSKPREEQSKISDRIRQLQSERKAATGERRKELSKELNRAMREQLREKQNRKLDELIARGSAKELQSITQGPKKKQHIANIRNADGHLKHSKADIAEVFAVFYESLYFSEKEDAASGGPESQATVSEVRASIDAALKKMSKNEACAEDGVVAEMLKDSGRVMLNTIGKLFCDLLNGKSNVPEAWCKTRLAVLFKKGDATLPPKYRPSPSSPC